MPLRNSAFLGFSTGFAALASTARFERALRGLLQYCQCGCLEGKIAVNSSLLLTSAVVTS